MSKDTTEKSPKYLLVSFVILLTGVAVSMVQFEIPSVLTQVMEYYGIGMGMASWLMSIFTLAGIVFSMPAGRIAAKTSPRFMLLLGLGLAIAGSIISALFAQGLVLLICRGIEGVGLVCITVAGPLAIDAYVDSEHRGIATGIWGGYSIGSVLAEVSSPLIYNALGVRAIWVAMALVCALMVAVILLVLRSSKQSASAAAPLKQETSSKAQLAPEAPKTETQEAGTPIADALREEPCGTDRPINTLGPKFRDVLQKNVLLHIAGIAMYDVVLLTLISYAPLALQQRGMDGSLSGFLSTLPILLTPVVSPICGIILDKFGHAKLIYLLGVAVSGPCTFIILTQTGPIIWVAAVIFGLFCSCIYPVFIATLPNVLSSHHLMPLGMGLANLVTSVGLFLGTFLPPYALGANANNWLACASLALSFCVVGVICVAFEKIKNN